MSLTPSTFGFDLNNREISTLIYLSILLIGLLLWQKGRVGAFDIVRNFFHPRLAIVWLHMSLYVAACVWLLSWFELWDWPNLKTTLLWWLTVGFTCAHKAQGLQNKPNTLRDFLGDAFKLSIIIIFIAELVSFPLWVEMPMFLFLLCLTLLIAVSESQLDTARVASLLKMLRGLQVLVGLLILFFSYWKVTDNITEHFSLNNLREFCVPLLLWLMFIPYIFFLAIYMTYEEVFNYLHVRPRQAPLVRYARRRALFNFGWNIDAVKRLARDMRTREIIDRQGVEDTILEIKRLLEIEKNPPTVMRADGWSPYTARRFLEEYDLITGDYHHTQGEWFAHITAKLGDKMFADQISYYLTGNEHAVTQLRLKLDGSNDNDTIEARRSFDARALTLLAHTLGINRAETIYLNIQTSEAMTYVVDEIQVFLNESKWGDELYGGYTRKLTIQHTKHQEYTWNA